MTAFTRRLNEARRESRLSQERLGILAGIDEATASARLNQYEKGKVEPNFDTLIRIAAVLNIPVSYFFEENDEIAWLIKTLYRADELQLQSVLSHAKCILSR